MILNNQGVPSLVQKIKFCGGIQLYYATFFDDSEMAITPEQLQGHRFLIKNWKRYKYPDYTWVIPEIEEIYYKYKNKK